MEGILAVQAGIVSAEIAWEKAALEIPVWEKVALEMTEWEKIAWERAA